MITDPKKLETVWRQSETPVIYRESRKSPLLLKLPYREDNRVWLQNGRRNKPEWVARRKCWEIPKAWLKDTVDRTLDRWGKMYFIQPYRQQEKCAPACWNAAGYECECSCMGEHHGSGDPSGRWFIVSDTFATKWKEKELACRLLTAKQSPKHDSSYS